MPSKQPKSLNLTEDDRLRLEKMAPAFDIEISQLADGRYRLRSSNERVPLDAALNAEIVHVRLLVEICSRAVHWVYFRVGESCRDTFLGQSDARIERVAVLYGLHRDAKKALMRARAKGGGPVDQRV